MLRLSEVALTARMALVVLMFLSGASTAAAQPYAWVPVAEFRDFVTPLRNILRVVNLGTTHDAQPFVGELVRQSFAAEQGKAPEDNHVEQSHEEYEKRVIFS